ncbi:MAG: hypothetical protein ATN35_02090 [Epulopiscium sp. Nele67-Bin004]|nr:MAG: hypothetical protein ATN35_02090 [Epulopiscium sp. Nele67-Bin004]
MRRKNYFTKTDRKMLTQVIIVLGLCAYLKNPEYLTQVLELLVAGSAIWAITEICKITTTPKYKKRSSQKRHQTIKKIAPPILHSEAEMEKIDKMDGYTFEIFICNILEKHNYKSYVTPRSRDFGADVIAEKDGIKIAVQVKRYTKNVGQSAVREANSAKDYYETETSMVVTNSYFTKSAKQLANKCGVKLIDRDELQKWF